MELLDERDGLAGALKHIAKQHKEQSLGLTQLPKDTPDTSRQIILDDIKDKLTQTLELKQKIDKIDRKLELAGEFEFTVDEFLNIANVAADKMRAGGPVEKDAIARL